MSDAFDLSELFTDFRDEGRGQVAELDDALLRLEREGALADDARTALLRALHTLKGNAGMLGLRPLQERVHQMEGVFKAGSPSLGADDLQALHQATGAIRRAVERAGTPGQEEAIAALAGVRIPAPRTEPAPAPASPSPSPSPAPAAGDAEAEAAPPPPPSIAAAEEVPTAGELRDELLRIPFARVDTLLNRTGDLGTAVAELRQWAAENRAALEAAGLRRALLDRADALDTAFDAVRRGAAQLRTVTVARLFARFPALAADLARAQGKRVRVEIAGEQTELDRSTADALAEPLLHLVRNAIDHGVEPPGARAAAGKPPEATLRLAAAPEGDLVRIEVEDDGAGIDLERVRQRAVERGWIAAGEAPDPRELAEMVFRPGFSTRSDVTELSGRGIGLDIVRSRVARLRGSVEVHPGEGGGTRFVLWLPLTVALVPALFFESGGEVLALPASDVEEVARVDAAGQVGPAEVVEVRGEALPTIRLPRVFGWEGGGGASPGVAVVVRRGERGAAILADRLLDQRPATIRPLPAALGRAPGVSGATVDAAGRVVLLLDAGELMELNVDFYRGAARGG